MSCHVMAVADEVGKPSGRKLFPKRLQNSFYNFSDLNQSFLFLSAFDIVVRTLELTFRFIASVVLRVLHLLRDRWTSSRLQVR